MKKLTPIILFTIPNFDTAGSGKALLNIAKRLDKNIITPQICCSHSKGEFFKTVKKSGIKVHIKETTHEMIPRFTGLKKCIRLASFFKSLNISMIHSFHYSDDYSEALAAKMAGIPWIYTKKNMNWGGKSKNSWLLRSLLSKYIIAQNNDMLNTFFKNSKKATLVPRGISIDEYNNNNNNNSLLESHGIPRNNKIILCVANLTPVKGIEILLIAFNFLFKEIKNIHLIIVGDNKNKYGEDLIVLSKKMDSSSNIIFKNKTMRIQDYYSIANFFVLPTIKKGEGCPVALLEAMASNLIVFGSNISGIKDILSDTPENLFQEGDSVDLKNKLKKALFLDKNKLKKQIIKNRNKIKKYYSIELETLRHENIYKKILNLA